MSQHPASGMIPRPASVLRSCLLALLCCLVAAPVYGQALTPVTRAIEACTCWSESQKQTYMDAKAVLDRGEALTSRLRRALEDVCDQLALSLRSEEYVSDRGKIRDLLVDVDVLAVRGVTKHLLTAGAPDEVRLYGIVILVSIPEAVKTKEGIVNALNDPSPAVRLWAARGVVKKGYVEAGEGLVALLLDDSPEVRLVATQAVADLKVAGAEGHLVSLVERESVRRAPLTQQLAQLQQQLKAIEARTEPSEDDEQQISLLNQRIEELSGRVAFINLLIYRAGETLSTLSNGADGLELKGALSDEDLQKVINDLRQKYGSAVS